MENDEVADLRLTRMSHKIRERANGGRVLVRVSSR